MSVYTELNNAAKTFIDQLSQIQNGCSISAHTYDMITNLTVMVDSSVETIVDNLDEDELSEQDEDDE